MPSHMLQCTLLCPLVTRCNLQCLTHVQEACQQPGATMGRCLHCSKCFLASLISLEPCQPSGAVPMPSHSFSRSQSRHAISQVHVSCLSCCHASLGHLIKAFNMAADLSSEAHMQLCAKAIICKSVYMKCVYEPCCKCVMHHVLGVQ